MIWSDTDLCENYLPHICAVYKSRLKKKNKKREKEAQKAISW